MEYILADQYWDIWLTTHLIKEKKNLTCEPFLLPGKFMMRVFPRIPHTGLYTNQDNSKVSDFNIDNNQKCFLSSKSAY